MKTVKYNDGLGHRSLKPMLLFKKQDAIIEFKGSNIPGVCVITNAVFDKCGKWSNTSYTLQHGEEYTPVTLRQDWNSGRFINRVDSVETMAADIGCADVRADVVIEFIKRRLISSWTLFEEVQANLKLLGGGNEAEWEEKEFSDAKISNRAGRLNTIINGKLWDWKNIPGVLVIIEEKPFDGAGGGGTAYRVKIIRGTSIEVKTDDKMREEENLIKAEKIGLPKQLMVAFRGSEDHVRQFMLNVEKLPVNLLDKHIVSSCGRARVSSHLLEVSGNPDFFCGADPNGVVGYISDKFFPRREE